VAAFKLYEYYRSSCSWRVRIALAIKNIAYESVPIHLLQNGGEQFSPTYEVLNPAQQVPVLEIVETGHSITQSLAIIEYLDTCVPAPKLYPQDPIQRSRAQELALHISCGTQPLQNLATMRYLGAQYALDKAQQQAWSHHWIQQGLAAFAQLHDPKAGPYAAGNSLSIADICLYPQLYNARRFNVELANYPALLELEDNLHNHPAFHSTHPDRYNNPS